jgi:hypothetical protein
VTQYEHVISMPFNEIEAKDDLERAEKMVQKCIEVRGVKVKVTEVPVPVPYGSAFEGEVVRKKEMRVEFGGKYSRAFEYLRMVDMAQVAKVVSDGLEPIAREQDCEIRLDLPGPLPVTGDWDELIQVAMEGESGLMFFVVESGELQVDVHGQAVSTIGPGGSFGEIALIDRRPRTATVTAVTDVRAYGLPVFVFRPYVEARPQVAWKLLEALADRVVTAESR